MARAATTKAHANGVPINLEADLVKRIDAVRNPLIPRATFVKDLLRRALLELEDA